MWTDTITGTVANAISDCNIGLSVKVYDRSVGNLNIQFDMATFNGDSNCSQAINPTTLGYDPTTDGNTFTFTIDVHTLYASLAQVRSISGSASMHLLFTTSLIIRIMLSMVLDH